MAHKLLSITRELSHGAVLSINENKDIVLTYRDGSKIVCDRRLKTEDGWMPGVELILITAMANIAHTLTERKSIPINVFHKQVGHPSFAVTKSTATPRGIKLQGPIVSC